MESMLLCDIPWYLTALGVIMVIVCMVLIAVVLLQKGRGGGLSAAFGGAGGQSAFGSKTGDVFTWFTIGVVGAFLILAMLLAKYYKPSVEDPTAGQPTIKASQPAESKGKTPAAPAKDAKPAVKPATDAGKKTGDKAKTPAPAKPATGTPAKSAPKSTTPATSSKTN